MADHLNKTLPYVDQPGNALAPSCQQSSYPWCQHQDLQKEIPWPLRCGYMRQAISANAEVAFRNESRRLKHADH